MKLQDSITTIKGIGEKKAAVFAKAGIHTIEELLTHYPRSYETYGEPVNFVCVGCETIRKISGIYSTDPGGGEGTSGNVV